ncbi:Fic family protein [Nitratireductor soli]|uniref:Fic family protein n=1 Tax=Nitratireductor soli TaxID=1670619 RepID=UPI00065E06A9|nr:Fic family protein [Nitratireductor soli]
MNLDLFSPDAPGRLIPTIQGATAFVPSPLPPKIDLAAVFSEYGSAMAGIGMLNAKMAQLGNPKLIIRPLQRREALLSSAMEGTYTTSDELALFEIGADGATKADTKEVFNYVTALTHSVSLMRELPICHRLIREAHDKLLSGLSQQRGGHKRPGEYKHDQNWIGGVSPSQARFVPPPPAETVEAMNQLEAFINRDAPEDFPPLIEAALVHYQFETIHPFADGNGRVGRILIPLVLLSRGLIKDAVFYPSASLESKKDIYIDRMFDVSTKGDWTSWVRFFLKICQETCESSIEVVDKVLSLQLEYRERAMKEFRSNNVVILIDHLFSSPVVSTPIVMGLLNVTHRAARMTIGNLERIGVLEKMEGFNKPEYFVARPILRAGS